MDEFLRAHGVVYKRLETERILPSPEIQSVVVNNPAFGDADVDVLSTLQLVRAIDVSGTRLAEPGVIKLLRGRDASLLHLDVSGIRVSDAIASRIHELRGVWSLRLANCSLTDEVAMKLLDSKAIRFLDLQQNALTDALLALLTSNRELTVLSVEGNEFSSEGLADFAAQRPDVGVLAGDEMTAFLKGKWSVE